MEDQFIHASVRAETELHAELVKLADDEGSALIRTQSVSWLTRDRQREFSVLVLPDNQGRASLAESAGAMPAEGRIRAIASRNAVEDDVLDERLERNGYARNIAFAVGGK
jgi:hypothetical protein